MSNEHIENIRKARTYLVAARRNRAETLAKYLDAGSSSKNDPEHAAALASIQAGIAALDAAREEEAREQSRSGRSSPPVR
jgi:hypothetical protein